MDAHELERKPLQKLTGFCEPFSSEVPLCIVVIVEQYYDYPPFLRFNFLERDHGLIESGSLLLVMKKRRLEYETNEQSLASRFL